MNRVRWASLGSAVLAFILWSGGFAYFVYDMDSMETFSLTSLSFQADTLETPPSLDPVTKTEAIIVLTGGADRLDAGLHLLKKKAGRKLLLSGVHKDVQKKDLLIQDTLPVELGYQAESTIENALEARSWLQEKKVRSFYLVTAHYHMRRALLEFHQRLNGFEIIPYPVLPKYFQKTSFWQQTSLVTLVMSEYNKYILALCRAFVRSLALTLGFITDASLH